MVRDYTAPAGHKEAPPRWTRDGAQTLKVGTCYRTP